MVCDSHLYNVLFDYYSYHQLFLLFILDLVRLFLRFFDIPVIGTCLAIPTVFDGGNHTRSFAKAAATTKAHYACLDVSKALAATGVRVLTDDTFFEEV